MMEGESIVFLFFLQVDKLSKIIVNFELLIMETMKSEISLIIEQSG